ncbi:MAG TPA: peptidoglycan-binding protein [Candidatus Paceibacterota bacterium]|jgi:ferredoxin|nr:peptidoglycan-binding protein [Candidatus Paceibacterota bacterium]
MKITHIKISKIGAVTGTGLLLAGLLAAGSAYAMTPSFSLSNEGNGTVEVSVSGDPNYNVMFYYNVGSSSGGSTTLGTTNSSGYFSETISPSSYNIISGDEAYVIVNGQQSSMQVWPAPSGTPTLSETSVTLGLGQTAELYSTGSSAGVYMASNSNPSVASIETSGTEITITAIETGGTTATICYSGTASSCAGLNITVQTGSVLSFSQNNFTVGVGQGTAVSVSGGSGVYSVSSNSNPGVASAVQSGNTITVTGEEDGTTNVSVCDTSGNCGTLYITVSATTSSGSLSFSNANPSVTLGETVPVSIYGGSGYYITGNSNPSVVSPSVNGSSVNVEGLENGQSTITVCSSSNGCGYIYVTVGGSTTTSGNVNFGVTNPSLTVGESYSVSLSGSGSYYISSNPSSGVASASVSGSTLTLYGESIGSDSVAVCASGGGCNTIYVTVGSQSTAGTGTTSASVSALLSSVQSMQTELAQIVTQIQSMETTLTQLTSSAEASLGTTTSGGTTTTGTTSGLYDFTQFLGVGSENADVTALQQYLTNKGFYTGPITGFYGTETEAAVEQYQSAHGIDPVGYVGPSTRAALNIGE